MTTARVVDGRARPEFWHEPPKREGAPVDEGGQDGEDIATETTEQAGARCVPGAAARDVGLGNVSRRLAGSVASASPPTLTLL